MNDTWGVVVAVLVSLSADLRPEFLWWLMRGAADLSAWCIQWLRRPREAKPDPPLNLEKVIIYSLLVLLVGGGLLLGHLGATSPRTATGTGGGSPNATLPPPVASPTPSPRPKPLVEFTSPPLDGTGVAKGCPAQLIQGRHENLPDGIHLWYVVQRWDDPEHFYRYGPITTAKDGKFSGWVTLGTGDEDGLWSKVMLLPLSDAASDAWLKEPRVPGTTSLRPIIRREWLRYEEDVLTHMDIKLVCGVTSLIEK